MGQFTHELINFFKIWFEEGFDLDDSITVPQVVGNLLSRYMYMYVRTCMCSNTTPTYFAKDVVSNTSRNVSHSNPAASLTTCS